MNAADLKSAHIGQNAKIGKQVYMIGNLSQKDSAIIAQLIGEFVNRSKQDIQSWRQAIDAADNPETPKWNLLQDLYEYLRPDGHLSSQIAIRKGAILSNRFFIRDSKTGKENKDKTKLLQKKWFFNMIADLLDSIMFAYTVIQIPDPGNIPNLTPLQSTYDLIPRRNFIPQKNLVLVDTSGEKGVDITDPAFDNTIICLKNQYQFGIMNDIVPDLIWKKNARQAWAEFSEKFGIPLVKVITNKRNKDDLDKIENMAKLMGRAARAILPEGTTMDIIDSATKGDPHKIFLEQMKYSDSQISKAILGGTMISDNGSSRSQSEVHERTFNDKISEQDRNNIEFTINDQLLPILISAGMGFSEGDEFAYDRSESLSLTDLWKIAEGLLGKGYELDDQWLIETFNIPITGKKDVSVNFNKPSTAPAAFGGISWPVYNSCCTVHKGIVAEGGNAFKSLIKDLQDKILQGVFNDKDVFKETIRKGIAAGGQYRDGLFDGWGERRLNIAYNATDHRALALMEQNLFTFSSLKEKAAVLQLNRLLVDKEGKKLREYSDFKKVAEPFLNRMDVQYFGTEYNFAVATGQTASAYHQFLSEKDTVTSFVQYLTVGDDRVRNSHRALHGKIFSLDDPEARRLWPPNDFGCRCEFIQYPSRPSKDIITSGKQGIQLIDWNDKQAKMFSVNRGDIGQVFLQNQMYLKDLGFASDIRKMTFDRYGLDTWENNRKKYQPVNLDTTITPDNAGELFTPEPGTNYMGYEDYLNRKLILKEDVFKEHISEPYTGEGELRHQLFPKVKEAITDPDEVYLFNYKKGIYQMRYIKFYQDKVLIVPANIGNNGLEIMTWYQMKVKDQAVRNGLLIKLKP